MKKMRLLGGSKILGIFWTSGQDILQKEHVRFSTQSKRVVSSLEPHSSSYNTFLLLRFTSLL
jgi:hypothetical protein